MNWDVVFTALGVFTLAVTGFSLILGPIFIEDMVSKGNRGSVYKNGAGIVLALAVVGALLMGMGVPT